MARQRQQWRGEKEMSDMQLLILLVAITDALLVWIFIGILVRG